MLCVSINSNAEDSTAKWQPEPLTIDGSSADWGNNLRFFNSDSRIHYEFRNDDRNLYLIVKTTDLAIKHQIVQAGMKLKFKVKSDPRVIATMDFPALKGGMGMRPQGKGGKRNMSNTERPAQDQQIQSETDGQQPVNNLNELEMKPEFRSKDSVLIEGFLFGKNAVVSDSITPNAICFAKSKRNMSPDRNSKSNGNIESAYEICIPLREFFGDNYSLEKIATISIQLQVLINGSSESNNGGGRMRGGMRGRGGMGGPGGGGEMGGPGGGGEMGGPGGGGEEMGGGEGELPEKGEGEMGESVSMTKKSFNANFVLSTKPQ